MAIKSISKEAVKFVPVYSGNREDSNPLWVLIHPLSRMEVDRYLKRTKYFQKQGSRGEWDSNTLEVQKKEFIDNVIEVHNFLDCDNGEEIRDIERFYQESPHQLIEEILQAVMDVSFLKDQEIKN